MRILGIDPGTGITGFGVVDFAHGRQAKMVTAGVIRTPAHTPMPDRLLEIYEGVAEIIEECKPDEVAIEKLFFNTNTTTAISVAQARGVCVLKARQEGLPIAEYTPLQVKKTMTGYGVAEKKQIQEMVRQHLGLSAAPRPDDAADALAIAITHNLMRGKI